MCLGKLFDFLLWGTDRLSAEYYNRMGDCFYFSFFRFQLIRSFYLGAMIIMTFMILYFDLRMFIFLIQDWKMLTNWVSLALLFGFSGIQRTEIIVKTNAYYALRLGNEKKIQQYDEDEEETEKITPFSHWKAVILLYELAQTLNLFHTIAFWLFWYDGMYDYYMAKDPSTPINKKMRIIIMVVINTLPPIFMIFDMIFSKILFRLWHFMFGLIWSILFVAFQYGGRKALPTSKHYYQVIQL